MLAAERRATIVAEIRAHGGARVADLAASLDVSEMTIRRDLDELAHDGAVTKVHGGAVRTGSISGPPSSDEPGFDAKSERQQAEKAAIARAAAALVEPGATIGLSAGTTTYALAGALAGVPGLTVVTNSMGIATLLHGQSASRHSSRHSSGHSPEDSSGHAVVLTGGVRTPSDALVGPLAVAALATLHLDLVVLGVHGIDVDAGFTTPNLLEAETDRALVAAGRRLVVVADHTKWATVGLSTIAPLARADVLVTDDALAPDAATTLSDHVGELILAPTHETGRPR